MKFLSSFSLLTFSIGAVSGSTLARRDLATIQGVLTSVSQQVDALDSAIKAFSGDATPLTTASNNLLSTIRSGVTSVSATSALSENDALSIATYVTGLNTSVANAVNQLISQKNALVAACAGGTILQELTDQKSASTDLANAITSKVPTDLQALAGQLSEGIASSLQSGIDAFQGASGGTCSSTTGGSAPPPTSYPSGPGSSSESGSASPTSKTGSASLPPTYPSSSASAPPTYPTSSGSVELPPAYPSSSSTGGSSPSAPTGSSGVSPPSSESSTPAVFTGGASASQVGTSTLAFVIGCVVLFM